MTIIFCSKLLAKLHPNQLDERAITVDVINQKDKQDNMNLALFTGKGIGLRLHAVKMEDLIADQVQCPQNFVVITQIFTGRSLS